MLRLGIISRSLRTTMIKGNTISRPIILNTTGGFNGGRRFNSNTSNTLNTLNTSSTSNTNEISDRLTSFVENSDLNNTITTNLHSNQLGYLDSIGLAQGWGPTSIIEKLLELTHVYSDLPWWTSIIVLTLGIRVLLFPLYVKSSSNATRMSKVKPQLDLLMKEIKNGDVQDQMRGMEKRRKIMKQNNISTLATLAPMVQLPLAYGFFQALRKMSNYPVEGFTNQGYAWFQDLTAVDPYLGLQTIAALSIIAVVRIGGETGQHAFAKSMKTVMTIVPLVSILITKNFSAAIVLYFAVNSIFSLFQSFILKNNFCRKLLKMPPKLTQQQLENSNQNANQSLKETFNSFIETNREKAIEKTKQANKKLEVKHQRKLTNQNTYIKRH
ncbi:unnamed protein product [Candida verbasci]|uniref:Membrane insertase YidC/Oxa/ALB C-terminal domain-containing protein n=1 Tax=Candida verbasci TaxID=1227364 RepID=A0A9W4TXN6_9ASCO|nr:unnamed protein product [Candida verbasci]